MTRKEQYFFFTLLLLLVLYLHIFQLQQYNGQAEQRKDYKRITGKSG